MLPDLETDLYEISHILLWRFSQNPLERGTWKHLEDVLCAFLFIVLQMNAF